MVHQTGRWAIGMLAVLLTVATPRDLPGQVNESDSAGVSDSKAERVLTFPTGESVGVVYTRSSTPGRFGGWNEFEGWERLADALGDVTIPAGHEVRLDIGTVAAKDLSPLDALRPDDLTALWLSHSEVNDEQLRHVGRLTGLIDLHLASTYVTDAGIANLSGLRSLRSLNCEAFSVHRDGAGISDASAATLASLPALESIDLRLTKFTDAGLQILARLPKLRSLELAGTAVTDAGIKSLRGKTTLQTLSLGLSQKEGCAITDAAVDDLCTLTDLRFLRLTGTHVTDAGASRLSVLEELQVLSIDDTEVTIDAIARLTSLSRLEYLRVPFSCGDREARVFAKFPVIKRITGYFDAISDEGLESLAASPALEWVDLSSRSVTARGLAAIGRMRNLKYLWLYEAPVQDDDLRLLSNLKHLELAVLDLPQIDGPGLRHLARIEALKELRLTFNDASGQDADESLRRPVDLSSLTALQNLESLTLNGDRLEPASLDGALELVRLKSLTVDTRLEGRHVQELSHARRLDYLFLSTPSQITDDGLQHLARLTELQKLRCRGFFTDHGLEHLASLKQLTFLFIASPFVTERGLDRLKARLPGLTIVHREVIGTDEQTLTAIRNRSYWPDDETVLKELDRVQITLNVEDNLFRNGSREQRQKNGANALEGQAAPPLSAARWLNVPNNDFSPPSLLGHLTILHAWGNWNDAYRGEMSQLKRVQQRYGRFGVQIVSVHSSHEADRAENALKDTPINWPCAIDRDDQTRNDYPGGPYFLIGSDGHVLVAGLHPIDLETAVQRFVLKQRRSREK